MIDGLGQTETEHIVIPWLMHGESKTVLPNVFECQYTISITDPHLPVSVLVCKNAMVSLTDSTVVTFFTKLSFEGSLIKMSYFGHIIHTLGQISENQNTLRYFEVAVRDCFLKELVMLNPFLGSAKVKKNAVKRNTVKDAIRTGST